MRILVTGGTGFVGRAFVRRAIAGGMTLGFLLRSEAEGTGPRNSERFVLGPSPWTVQAIAESIAAFAPDALIHLAGQIRSATLEEAYAANAILGERVMAAMEHAAPAARTVVVGSAAEYGVPRDSAGLVRPQDACRPYSPYGIAKLAQTLHALARSSRGQDVLVARLFNPVGAGMPRGLVFTDIAARLASGQKEIPVGNLDVRRDFMPVDEAARILLALLAAPEAGGMVVNVCSGEAQSIRVGVEDMMRRLPHPVRLVSDPALLRAQEVLSITGDVAALRSLGIEPAASGIGAALADVMEDALVSARAESGSAQA